jgi:hypothetical protein
MNIDELKDAWGHDEPTGMHLPDSTAALGKTTSVVAKLRKNMKSEFIGVIVSYGILFYFTSMIFVYGEANTSLVRNAISIPLFTIMALSCFYYSRFYIFYRSISRYDLNMRSSVRKFTYELELNTEIYKTYNFCVTPLAVLVATVVYGGKTGVGYIEYVLNSNFSASPWALLAAFAVILIAFTATYFGITYHVRSQYGKYVVELKKITNDLEDEG